MPYLTKQEAKEFFEANYLDGDKIQDGQTLSSRECFEAIETLRAQDREAMREWAESRGISGREKDFEYEEWIGYTYAINDLISHLDGLKQ